MQTDWTVLLVGGSSGTGKTYLAHQLAERYGISHMEADDPRVALRTVTNREAHPELFTFVDHQNFLEEFTQEEYLKGHLKQIQPFGLRLTPSSINMLVSTKES